MPVINFSGLASGIDTSALIKATSDATRKTRVEPAKKKVQELEETNSSLDDLTKRLTDLRNKLTSFSTLEGGGVAKTATSSAETVVTATAGNSALPGTYTVDSITSIARNHTLTYNNNYASTSTPLNAAINNGASAANRTLTVQVGTPAAETVNVVLTNTTSLSDFVSSFNSSSTLATASVVNVGTTAAPNYRLMITSNNPGIPQGFLTVSNGSEVGTLGGNTASAATNAVFTVSGISGTITRSSNTVTDLFPGLTLELQAASVSPATITVATDVATTVSQISDFVDTYNDLVTFIDESNQITREEDGNEVTNTFSPLAQTRIDDGVLQALRDAFSQARSGGTGVVRILADLGISSQRDGTLKVDQDTLETRLQDNPSAASALLTDLADTVTATGGTIDIYTRFNGLIDITQTSNTTQITNQNTRIAEAEAQILKTEDAMRQRFARLEGLIGRLQSQQSALTSALGGLGGS